MKVNRKAAVAVGLSALILTLACSVVTISKRHRRFGVRPMNRNRKTEGFFNTLIKDMLGKEIDDEMFFKYSRMTPALFAYLVKLVGPHIQKDITKNPLSPEHRLFITVHYLAEGCSMQELAWGYRIGISTAHVIVKESCKAIWNVLSPIFVAAPSTPEQWERVSKGFFERWNLPNCIGALDGKHVTIMAPKKTGTDYFNYKKHFSLVLMACCDAFYRFTYVDIGAPGSNHDSSVFKSSALGLALLNGQLDIPAPRNIPNSNIKTPFYFAADSAFPLHNNIVRPFPGNNLGEKKNIFNYRLSRGRRTIENTFGIWSQRWRILRRPIVASIEVCNLVVQATICLHNFLQNSDLDLPGSKRTYCPPEFIDCEENGELRMGSWREDPFRLQPVNKISSNNATNNAKQHREFLSDYFVSAEGSLPWQQNYVLRGSLPSTR